MDDKKGKGNQQFLQMFVIDAMPINNQQAMPVIYQPHFLSLEDYCSMSRPKITTVNRQPIN